MCTHIDIINRSLSKEQRQYNRTNTVLSINHAGITASTCKRFDLDTDFIPFIEINTKWTMDLNVKIKNIKFLVVRSKHRSIYPCLFMYNKRQNP